MPPPLLPQRQGAEVSSLLARLAAAENTLHKHNILMKDAKDESAAEVCAMKRDYEVGGTNTEPRQDPQRDC